MSALQQNMQTQAQYMTHMPGLNARIQRSAWKHRDEQPVIVLRTLHDDVGGKAGSSIYAITVQKPLCNSSPYVLQGFSPPPMSDDSHKPRS